jgi:hypothetical protein
MSIKSTYPTNHIEDDHYTLPKLPKKRLIIFITGLFFFALITHFPAKQKMESLLRNGLKTIPGCRLNFSKLNIELLLPKIILQDLTIPGHCLSQANPLKFDSINLNFRGPSFSPLGLSFAAQSIVSNQNIKLYLALGANSQVIKFDNQLIKLDKIKELSNLIRLKGDINLNGLIRLDKGLLNNISLLIKSNNLVIPAQNIQGFAIPAITPKNLIIKAQTDSKQNNELYVQEFIIGDQNSELRAKFNGKIILNKSNLQLSQLDLKGEFALDSSILKELSFLEDLLAGMFSKADEFYQVKIGGNLTQPIPMGM